MQREPIYAALFALVSGIPAIKLASRRARAFADVGSGDQPALFMEQTSEQQDVTTKMPGKWTLHVDLLVYVNTGGLDPNVVPSTILNPILDAICTALVPPPQFGEQTLGGLVARCRVNGSIQIVEGVQGDQAMAVIPVIVFTPD